jgi:putative sigma-54 modulation protein
MNASAQERTSNKEKLMQLKLTGHHVELTEALRTYIEKRLERLSRHFDQLIDIHVVLTVEKLEQKAEATLHVSGNNIHAVAVDANMYPAIDALCDKLDRAVTKHKEKIRDHHASEARKTARL